MTPRRSERQAGRIVRTGGRETDLRRGPATREQRRTVLITTNGESTERAYFDALKREPWVSVKAAVAVERGSPVDLVRGTYRRQQESDYDEAWAGPSATSTITHLERRRPLPESQGYAWPGPTPASRCGCCSI